MNEEREEDGVNFDLSQGRFKTKNIWVHIFYYKEGASASEYFKVVNQIIKQGRKKGWLKL